VPGIQISEHFPKLAQLMNHGAIIRSMSTSEGAHARAQYHMHTGYKEGQGGLVYPSLGSIVSAELGRPEASVPNFVAIGNNRAFGAGFLGARHQPLVVNDPKAGVENLRALVGGSQFSNRVGLLEEMEQGFFKTYGANAITDHQTTYQRAVQLMQSKKPRPSTSARSRVPPARLTGTASLAKAA